MLGLITFIIVFSVLIFVHEFGHFVTAKIAGVTVSEFGFGYPPRIAKLGTWHGTDITLNALPVGGFVLMSEDDPSEPGGVANKPIWVRLIVFSAGALMNLLLAIALYAAVFTIGTLVPMEEPGAGIYSISVNSPAESAGLQSGDNIISLNGVAIDSADQAGDMIAENVGQELTIVVERDGEQLDPVTVVPRVDPPEGEGALGISISLPLSTQSYPIWQAIPKGFQAAYNSVRNLFWALQQTIVGNMKLEVTGVVGIYNMTTEVAQSGLVDTLSFAAWLSLNLALFNMFPLPALDGGRVVFVLLEWIRRGKRVAPEKEGMVHAIGMMVLLAMFVVVTIWDVQRYYG